MSRDMASSELRRHHTNDFCIHIYPFQLPIKELKQKKRKRIEINLTPQGVITLVIEYFANMESLSRKPTSLLSSGVFGVPIEVVAK